MSKCNYCSYQNLKRRAKKEKKNISTFADAKWGMGGVNIYMYPKDMKIEDIKGGEDEEKKEYRVAWYMELPEHCCC